VQVEVLEELGSDAFAFFPVQAGRVSADVRNAEVDDASLLAEDDRALFTARIDPATPVRVGASLRLAVDPSGFHFFDAESGESLLPASPRSPSPGSSVVA